MYSSLREPQHQMQVSINPQLATIISPQEDPTHSWLIQSTTWTNKLPHRQIAIIFFYKFIEPEEKPTAKTGKEETSLKYASLPRTLSSTKINGSHSIKLAMDSPSNSINLAGLASKYSRLHYSIPSILRFMVASLAQH